MKKVVAGQKFEVSANTWNAFVDAAKNDKNQRFRQGQGALGASLKSGIIEVCNKTKVDLDIYSVVAITDPILLPSEDENEFLTRRHEFYFKTFGQAPLTSLLAITQEPIAIDGIGRVMVFGASKVKINVPDNQEDVQYAKVIENDVEKMQGSYAGPAKIIWREGGTGDQYAVISFSDYPWINDEPSNPYEIDRSDSADDSKSWNPAIDVPVGWESYDGVKLTMRTLRYVSGVAASLEYVDQVFQWLTPYAPIIEAVAPSTATTSTC